MIGKGSNTGKKLSTWILFLPVFYYFYKFSGFPYSSEFAEFSDYTITHYPNILFLKQSLANGHFPLWSSSIFSGYPFFANPLSGLWYLPGWIALLFPQPLGTNLVAALHLLFGGIGVYKLLKKEGIGYHGAIFGGLVFEFLPKIISHYGAGHLTLIYAIPWTPWLLLSVCKTRKGSTSWHLYSPIILAIICLADVRWVVFAGALWIAYVVAHRYGDDRSAHFESSETEELKWCNFFQLKLVKRVILQITLAVFLSSPLLVPLYEYSKISTRALLTVEESLEYSLPPLNLLGFLFPNFGGNHEYMIYCGAALLIITVLSIFKRNKSRYLIFWLWTGLISLVLALDLPSDFSKVLYSLPIIKYLRVPSRTLFITCFSLVAISAHGIKSFQNEPRSFSPRQSNILLIILNGLSISFTLGIFFIDRDNSINFFIGAIFIFVSSLWIKGRLIGRIPTRLWITCLIFITFVELGILNQSLLSFKSQNEVLTEKRLIVDYLADQEGDFRVYSPSYSVPQHIGMLFGIQLVDGVDPLQIAKYSEFMTNATGVPETGYSVSIPPFVSGNPESDNVDYSPDLKLLGLLNTRYIISEFDIHKSGLEEIRDFGGTRIYLNHNEFPRAWVQLDGSGVSDEIRPAQVVSYEPNQIEVQAEGPGQLILSEIDYPGWMVNIDGNETDYGTFQTILRSVKLAEGNHTVTFLFRPVSLYIGLTICTIGFVAMTFYYILVRKQDVQKN